MKNTKMNGKSINPQEELLALLKKKFPEVFAEGKVDCQKLKQTLGEEVDLDSERYGMTWAGKSNCFRVIQEPTTATLIPAKDESVDFDTTENLFIEGDNLEVLKVLQKSYYGKVKMIYIDPPYNTGNDFIYNDDFKQDREEYQQEAGIKDDNGNLRSDGLMKNTRDRGHYHSDWLNMMYPRLFLARNLMRQDGVIFVSIDDNEVHNLRMMMNEIFGEENFVGQLPTVMNLKGNNDEYGFAGTHEHTMVYVKNKDIALLNQFSINEDELEDWQEDEKGFYKQGANLKATGTNAPREKRPNLYFPIFVDENNTVYITLDDEKPKKYTGKLITLYPITKGKEMSWRWSKNKFIKDIEDVIISRNGGIGIYKKQRPAIGDLPSKKPKTIFYKPEYSSGNGTAEIKELFNEKVFPNPKPSKLLKDFIEIGLNYEDIILDFFAGSGTTAHAVMQLNAEDGGNRKCISVQLPELCDEKSEAYKASYKTIADISKERIRRAGKKIRDGIDYANLQNTANKSLFGTEKDNKKYPDTGFKVFKLDQSNFKIWRTDVKNDKELMDQMNMFVDNVKKESTQDNILYELVLKSGLDLNVQVEKKKADKKTYYSLDGGKLVICLEDKISQGLVDAILADKPEKAICLDKAFGGNDQLKTNTVLQMEGAKVDFKII